MIGSAVAVIGVIIANLFNNGAIRTLITERLGVLTHRVDKIEETQDKMNDKIHGHDGRIKVIESKLKDL